MKYEHTEIPVPSLTDTIKTGLTDIIFTGYEKAQNSSSESVFVTNKSAYRILAINFTIEYLDAKDRQLNKSTHTVKCFLPPDETRNISWKTWDKQHLWYYIGSAAKYNEYGNPFDIRMHINYIVIPAE